MAVTFFSDGRIIDSNGINLAPKTVVVLIPRFFVVVIPVLPKLNSLPEGRPVNPEPSPTNLVAVATPVITTPLLFASAFVALPNLSVAASIPVKAVPLPTKLVAVTTPVNLPSPPTSSFDDGRVDPIPTFPPEFCETPPVPD